MLGAAAGVDSHSVANEESAKAVVGTAIDAFGKVDILINNASVAFFCALDEMSADDVHAQVDAHLLGTIWMWSCRVAIYA